MRIEPGAIGSLLLAAFSTLLIGLAAGAVWMVLALYQRGPSAWMALPIGLALGWVVRTWVTPRRRPGLLLAAAGMAVATIYMRLLFAAAEVGASLGLGFGEALRTAGPGMLLNVARLGLHWQALALYLLGLALAAMFAAGMPRQQSRGA